MVRTCAGPVHAAIDSVSSYVRQSWLCVEDTVSLDSSIISALQIFLLLLHMTHDPGDPWFDDNLPLGTNFSEVLILYTLSSCLSLY